MLVYHGTSFKHWKQIKKSGLLPRSISDKSNWKHTIESNSDTVYFTDAYALFFGLMSIEKLPNKRYDRVVIIEVDTDDLEGELVPDEDALEQVARRSGDGLPEDWSLLKRTQHYRELTSEFSNVGLDFKWSLETLGTFGHKGIVTPDKFKRITIIDIKQASELSYVYMDLQVSVMNYKFLGPRWRIISKMIFDDKPLQEDLDDEITKQYDLPKMSEGIVIKNLKSR